MQNRPVSASRAAPGTLSRCVCPEHSLTTSKVILKQVAHHLITCVVSLTLCPAAGREGTLPPAPCSGTVCLCTGIRCKSLWLLILGASSQAQTSSLLVLI